MSESSNGDNAPQRLSAQRVESPQTGRVDPQFGVSLTPTPSVAVMGLSSMRYGATDNATTPGDFLPPAGLLNTMAFSGLPIGRYLSSLEMYERRNSGAAQQLRVPPGHSLLATGSAMAAAAALAAANSRALVGPGPAVDWIVASQTPMLGTPIATTCTTPALFVNSIQTAA
ncbi:hypothetical protein EV176_001061 [Coemansia sp. RSA 451]|nr:hypothetical protein EV176_001061 [Coemansia sp. RSA 451]